MSPESPASDALSRFTNLPADPELAMVFPGQGSQKVGMGKDVRDASPAAADVFAIADDTVGVPISALSFDGPLESLTATQNAQPAILATSIAILCAAVESGAINHRPAYVAGHSLGEYTALTAGGSLDLAEALKLVRQRGELMSTETGGTMAAIVGLDEAAVAAVCAKSGAEIANYNAPGQVVVGGRPDTVEKACALAKERGGRGLPLNVSGAFHTSLMDGAASKFAERLAAADIGDAVIPVVGNVDATVLTTASEIRDDLSQQVRSPVRWYQSMDRLADLGVTKIVEIGPGKVLSGQLKRSHPSLALAPIDEAEATRSASGV